MEFIDKNNQNIFLPIYTNLENAAWNDEENKYYGYNYDGLDKGTIKGHLITEQNKLCCYCMMEIEAKSTTLEHVFPQNPIALDSITNYSVSCLDQRIFDYSSRQIPNQELTNLPHDISYYNLTASCNSKTSCNNSRGNKIIKPFFFDPKVKNVFSYDNNGNIFSATYLNEIGALGLANEELKKYRKLWKYLKNHNITPSTDIIILKNQIKKCALIMGINDPFFRLFTEENEKKLDKAIKYSYFYQ
jgi:hypothetical protein